MAAVVGYFVVATIAIVVALVAAGPRYVVQRDPTLDVDNVAARLVGVMSALGAFAVTALVFLVTQAHNVPDPDSTSFTTVLAMFVVAYMGYLSSAFLFANISHRIEHAVFDLAAAQYAGASISLFAVFLGWFALRPLFETFGLTAIAGLVGWFLVGAVVVGYGLLATALFRSGYVAARMTVLMPVVAAVGPMAYGLGVAVFAPGLRSSDATLALTIVAFAAGVPAYLAMTILPIAAHRERLAPILAERWHLAIVAYAQGVMVLTGFLLLAVLGFA
jgi:hypothetical protein